MQDKPLATERQRIVWLDEWRGAALVSMIIYHALWDAGGWFGYTALCPTGTSAMIWQQVTCALFVAIAGFSFGLDRRPWRRGTLVLTAGMMITVVTTTFFPPGIHCGILTMLGTSILLSAALKYWPWKTLAPTVGAMICLLLFTVTRSVSDGMIGVGTMTYPLPHSWYAGEWSAWIGFPPHGFASLDYVPLLPWIFLFRAGYCWQQRYKRTTADVCRKSSPLAWLGRHSLAVYLLHQPIIYVILVSVTQW